MASIRTPWRRPGWDDVRCPQDGEMVNVRCWNCGWVRPTEAKDGTMTDEASTEELADETRVILVKPGDVLLIGNVGQLDPMESGPVLAGLQAVGIRSVLIFEGDIEIDKLPREQPWKSS